MKKILGIIFISLMFCNIGFADIYMKDGKHFEERLYQEDGLVVEVFCVDGYKFVGPFNHFDDALNKRGNGYVAELSKEIDNE